MRRALFVAAAGLLVGCGFTEVHQVVLRVPSGPTSRPVEIYVGEQPVSRPFYEIALLQVVGHGGDANLEDVTEGLRERAAYLGCDAVVRMRFDQGYSMAHGFGVCVKWAGPATAAVAPAAAPVVPPPAPANLSSPDAADAGTSPPDGGNAPDGGTTSSSGEVGF